MEFRTNNKRREDMTAQENHVPQELIEINLALLEGPLPFLRKQTYRSAQTGLSLLQNVLRPQLEQWMNAAQPPSRATIKEFIRSVEQNEDNRFASYQPFNSDHLTGAASTIAWISFKNVIDSVDISKNFLRGQIEFLDGETAWIPTLTKRLEEGVNLLEGLQAYLGSLLNTIISTGQLPLQSAVCTWAVAHRDASASSYTARLYWNNVITNLTVRSVELDPRKYISLVNQSDANEPFVIFADDSNGAVAWKTILPDHGGVAQVKVAVESYSFYCSWNRQGKVYKTAKNPIGFSPAKVYLVKITETDLTISVDDRPSDASSDTNIIINFENEIKRGEVPETQPLFIHISADDSDILVLQAFPFQGHIGRHRIDKELISRLSNLSVLVRQKTKPRQITPGKTYLAFKTEDAGYNILVNDSLYRSLCPHGIFPVSPVPAIHFLNKTDDPALAIAVIAKPNWDYSNPQIPWLEVSDWSKGIVSIPFGRAHTLSIDYDIVGDTFTSTDRYLLVDSKSIAALPRFGLDDYGFTIDPDLGKSKFLITVATERATNSGAKSEGISCNVWLNDSIVIRGRQRPNWRFILSFPFDYDLLAYVVGEGGGDATKPTTSLPIQPGQLAVIEGTKGEGYKIIRQTFVTT
jgi:hypothetical protein